MAGRADPLAPAQRLPGRPLRRAILLSFVNQAVGSGGNFLLSLYLARSMPLDQFGIYGMAYGGCMLYVGVGNALLLTQMTVGMDERAPAARAAFAARTLCGVLLMGAALLVLALAAAALMAALGLGDWPVVLLSALAGALMLSAEFFISLAYLQRRERGALHVNCATMLTLGAGLTAVAALGRAPSAATALLCYALGAALASALAYAGAPLALRHTGQALRDEWGAAWRHGRWALGGVAVTWIQAQSATYALAAVLGPAGAGLANLGRLFISPFSFLLPALYKVALPRLAALRRAQPRRMRQLSTRLTVALALLAALYAAPLLATLDWLAPLLLGHTVPQLAPMVGFWCLVLVAQVARSGGAQLLQMQLKFRALTLMNIPSAAVAVGGALLLMPSYAQCGAVAGLLAGELTLAFLIWKEIRHGARAESPAVG
jgi:O-antigen/teichoic acid export membrane protein